MVLCPACKTEIDDTAETCYICGYELRENKEVKWIVLGEIEDRVSADFAREALKSYKIPAVIFSRSGFFGNVGLPLNPFYRPGAAMFEVSVPEEFVEEASDILQMVAGDKWRRKED